MADTAVDFFLENLKQLMIREQEGYEFSFIDEITYQEKVFYPFSLIEKNKIECLYEDLGFLRSFIKDSEKKRYEHAEVKDLVSQIIDLAHEAEDIIDSLIVSVFKQRSMEEEFCHSFYPQRTLWDVIKDIKSIKKEVTKIYDEKLYGMGVPQVGISCHGGPSRAIPLSVEEETVVGFDHESDAIKDRLTGASQPLEIISIVGMAGSGKTSLARKLYNDPFIAYHFYIRGWTYVSQAYRKRDLLLRILSSVVEHKNEIYSMSDEKLEEELYRGLKDRRYLVVIDDIWHIEAWNDLRRSFPDDNNGSRIMFTTRDMEVTKPDRLPLSLHFLTEDESWDLLQQKVFLKESCPPGLAEIGRQIAKKCGGLPLAIVVIAGLLAKTEKTPNWWNQVAESVSSYIVSDPQQQCMYTLSLSYNHLPHHLKSCFLYFGAFPEDYEIRVRKLTWLWIAEGFIHQIGNKSLEDVAEECLMELIDRSLVLVAKKRSTGGIRACRVHDLLRDLCLRKAEEVNFLQQTYRRKDFRSFSSVQRRLCIHSHNFDYTSLKHPIPHIRSFLCFASEQSPLQPKKMPFIAFKLLRVLDLTAISIPYFPDQILNLVLLRYLALRGKELKLGKSISKLWNLETLIVKESNCNFISITVWKMVKLRHLCMGAVRFIGEPPSNDGYPSVLHNLQTITNIQPPVWKSFLARTPNLRKLGFCGNLTHMLLNLEFLNHLETLKLLNRYNDGHSYDLQRVKFPLNLKRLTLSNTALEWKEMSTLGMLPNLESLKLEFQACVGPRWETSDGGFRQLKFLKFYYMNIEEWNASNIHFPSLQCLVLHRCGKLKEIPSEFGDISTLQTIEVSWCSHSIVNSARQIQEEQQGMGNDWLKILIYPRDWELTTYS